MYFISLIFFILYRLILTTAKDSNYPVDGIAINCGSSDNSISLDGREWIGDIESRYTFSGKPNGKPTSSKKVFQSLFADPIPYMTARISHSSFAYRFQVTPGQKFIRLHFYPDSYPGFERSKALFTVKAGAYTLLSNFSASLTAESLSIQYFAKEFCVNVEDSQELNIIFSPSPSRYSDNVYAFVNGIEIISMPTGLYYTPEGNSGAHVVGQKHMFHIDNSTALELVHRLNIGGSTILSVEDWGLFRMWSVDSIYLSESGLLPVTTAIPIKYITLPTYTAPQKVYQTAWSLDPNKQAHKMSNLSWKIPVDLGFRYLVRLHFCELDYDIKESGQREFGIFINNKNVEACVDLIKWSGGNGVAMYRDYVVMMDGNRMEGKRDMLIALQPLYYESRSKYHIGAVLNGLEVFKLSNPDNNLAGPNPEPMSHAPKSSNLKLQKLLLAFGGNTIVSGLVILITSLNIIVYQLRRWTESFAKRDISSSSSNREELCRRFSLAEIQLATNNFDDALVIGDGGFGRVYKGVIDRGSTTVAVKRLKLMSKQGAEEFWTEIKMLSDLRHNHLVILIGYCNDSQEMILVYEYMVHGTLADHLHKLWRNRNGRTLHLSWVQRLNICIGAAHGLEYLHTGARHRIIHRDVKTSNILLDENWVAKISDFGLSKIGGNTTNQSNTYVITDVKGTFGYLDVEYFLTHRLTRKSDVYAFGVVLFEVLCGRPAVDKRFEGEERSLALWAQRCIKEGKLEQMIDPNIKGQISSHSLKVFTEVANKCLHNRPNERPRMSDVVQRLEFALASQQYNAYSSTDTERADEEEEMINFSMVVNLPTDRLPEGEGQRERERKGEDKEEMEGEKKQEEEIVYYSGPKNNQIDEVTLNDAQQTTSSVVMMQGNVIDMSNERTNKKGFAKVFQNITQGMDVRKKKMKASDPSGGSPWWWNRSARSTKDTKISKVSPESPSPVNPSPLLPESPHRACQYFSLAQLKKATKNFRIENVIKYGGLGGGEMYTGYIDNGKQKPKLQVAIERCIEESEDKFLGEVEMRSQLHHFNVVSLIGYCKDSDETILVYEYMERGSLSNLLYGAGKTSLPWKERLQICIDAAQGLEYLHFGCQEQIIHGDLKSSSILLDEKWAAKVSGLKQSKSKLDRNNMTRTVVTTVVKKALGYMDPEYLLSGHLTVKSDVYSFGVVLLEVLCAREPQCPHLNKEQKNLVNWFKSCIQKKAIGWVIDPYLIGKIAPASLREFVRIAEKCLLFRRIERPLVTDVLQSLKLALELQETAGEIQFGKPGDSAENLHASAIRAYNKVLN